MAYKLDQYVLDLCFNEFTPKIGDKVYWIEAKEGGYMVLFSDGEHIHTNHHPEKTFKEMDEAYEEALALNEALAVN